MAAAPRTERKRKSERTTSELTAPVFGPDGTARG